MLLVLVVALFAACGDDDDDEATGTTETTAAEVTETTAAEVTETTAAAGGEVTIVNFEFQPATLDVAAGTTVRWVNEGEATHTVTADEGSGADFDSGNLATDDTFEHTFEEAGTFAYHCEIHPRMTAEVVVSA